MARAIAYLGLGGNLGDVPETFRRVLADFEAAGHGVLAVASLYRSKALKPPGCTTPSPDYWNTACKIETTLSPQALLAYALALEKSYGRTRETRWADRTVDIDILLYGDLELNEEGLTIPHPEITKRPFVVAPLAELDQSLEIPGFGDVRTLPSATSDSDVQALSVGRKWSQGAM